MPKYNVIYADPPWKESGGGRIKRGADKHYNLMSTKDIMELPIINIAADNAHLYLWVTNNFLPDGLKVMEAWGFKYKTMITWVKDRFGLGQYFRGQTEHCLFGVRGFLPYKTENGKRCQGVTYFTEKRTKHSRKPYKMKQLIELVSCRESTKQIELFARNDSDYYDDIIQANSGCGGYKWDVVGNEIDGVDIREVIKNMDSL